MSSWRTGICTSALVLAFALHGSISARAETIAKCESEAVGVLNSWGNKIKHADEKGVRRPRLDDEALRMENGFFKKCPEMRNRVLRQMDIEQRLNAERLVAFLKEANSMMPLLAFEKLLLQHSVPPVVQGSDKCNSVAGLCKQDYDMLFSSYRDIGGPQFFEAKCTPRSSDQVSAGHKRPCEFLVNMKKEGIDNNTDSESFISRHGSCKDVAGACSAVKMKMFRENMAKIFERNTKTEPVSIQYAVHHSFASLGECRERLQEQKDLPDTVTHVEGSVEDFCRGIYKAAIEKKLLEDCRAGKVNRVCPATTGGVDPNPGEDKPVTTEEPNSGGGE